MRVLHVIPSVASVRGGPSQALLELAAAFKHSGSSMEIVTTNDDGPTLLDVPLEKPIEFSGAKVRFFRRFSPKFRPLREFAFSKELTQWLSQQVKNYDVIHAHALFSHAPSAAMRIGRKANVPYIVRPSGLLCRWSLQQSRLRKRLFLALTDRRNLNGSAAIEYTAEQEREEASDLKLTAPEFVMPYGLHIPELIPDAKQKLRRKLGLAQNEPVLLFLSRLHPKKGISELIAAVAGLSQRRFTLLIVGSGDADYETELKKSAAAALPPERIKFLGFAQADWKQMLLQGSDIFVLPSFSESFAIAALEALSVGLPVLTTRGVPLSVLVEKFNLGWICEPDAESIRLKLDSGLTNLSVPGIRELETKKSRDLIAKNFAWSVIAKRMADVYQAVLSGKELPSFELARMTL